MDRQEKEILLSTTSLFRKRAKYVHEGGGWGGGLFNLSTFPFKSIQKKAYLGTSRYTWKALQLCRPLSPGPLPFSLTLSTPKTHNVGSVSSALFGELLRTIVQETASHIVLKSCPKEVWGEVSVRIILMKGVRTVNTHLGRTLLPVTRSRCHHSCAFLRMRRGKKMGSYDILLKISNYLKACSASFSQSTEGLIPDLHPELLSGYVEGLQRLVTSSPCRAGWQATSFSRRP